MTRINQTTSVLLISLAICSSTVLEAQQRGNRRDLGPGIVAGALLLFIVR
ncbi:MAG: hypothetical protein MUP53_03255 [Bacteroidales bacterium]|nr:hypothetical protein [Bacteroidales bacterium]